MIAVKTSTGTYEEIPEYCDGSSATIL